jgi:predicted ATPase
MKLLAALAREAPLLLLLDDLQWADTGSVGLLFHLARKLTGIRILVLGLFRPSDVALGREGGRHPLESVVNELRAASGTVEIALEEGDDRAFVNALLDAEPNALDSAFRDALFRRTRGHALFTAELLRVMRERGLLVRERGRWRADPDLDWSLMPARIQATLRERISRLPDHLQRLLTVASVEGEVFTLEAVAEVLGRPIDDLLPLVSGDLERRFRLVVPHGVQRVDGRRLSEFRFRHVLFQRYLYDRLDVVERAHLHERVGDALESLYGDERANIAPRLAWHFREAGLADRAVHYFYEAGTRAEHAAAFSEAVAHFRAALELLLTLPPSEDRDRRELAIQVELGTALITSATPDETPYLRARVLGQQLGDDRLTFWATSYLYWSQGHYPANNRRGLELATENLARARKLGDPAVLAFAYENAAHCALMRGHFREALSGFQELERVYDPSLEEPFNAYRSVFDLGPVTQATMGLALWALGYADQARARTLRGVALASELESPITLLMMRCYHAWGLLWRGEVQECFEQSLAVVQAAEQLGTSAFNGTLATITLGWSMARLGRLEEGIAATRRGIEGWAATGWSVGLNWFTALLAETLNCGGRPDEGLQLLEQAIAGSRAIDDFWVEADIRRIRGDLLLAISAPDLAAAEAAFRSSIDLARSEEAKGYELRATTSLARLLRAQGRCDEAHSMLARIYGWFTEGFETADLKDAKALLLELS